MAQNSGSSGVKLIVALMAIGLALYILGPPLLHLVEEGSVRHMTSCPVCQCDCASDNLNSIRSSDLGNASFPDCPQDPDMRDELGKSRLQLLTEELELQNIVADESQQRAEAAYLDAKKVASQYQKEAEKCNTGMETSEEAREKAEAALVAEKKKSALWERRARSLGWNEPTKQDSIEARPDAKTLKGRAIEEILNHRNSKTKRTRILTNEDAKIPKLLAS